MKLSLSKIWKQFITRDFGWGGGGGGGGGGEEQLFLPLEGGGVGMWPVFSN